VASSEVRVTALLPVTRVRRALLRWYRRERRDLPWRRTRDPYRIWLSETMLQQTRVDTVIPYYERFLERFPSVEALATADEQDVLKEWAGLGYYARARNLKRAAETVVRDHGGALPRDPDALRALPGVGRYTAGALLSIAFRERAGIVDGNVRRVLSRWTADPDLGDARAWALAEALVPARSPDDFNQALMELGATVCTPRAPRCGACPVPSLCRAAASDDPEAFPRARKRPTPRPVAALAALVERGDRILMVRRPSQGLLGGMWELPSLEGDDADALVASIAERTGLHTAAPERVGNVRHGFTHRALTLTLLRLKPESGRPRGGARFCGPEQRAELPLSTLARKTLDLAVSSRA
jgi:A/G-specific adenine glycosylase